MSTDKNIYMTPHDHQRLSLLLSALPQSAARPGGGIDRLRGELARAVILDEAVLPPGVVTMNSEVQLKDLESGENDEYTLSFPDQADAARQRLSVLAPIGTAIIGYAEGDEVTWQTPGGMRRIRIERVRRPASVSTQ